MEILERPNGSRYGFAPLDNIGYFTFEVNLEGEVYTFGIPNKAERVGNKWKIRKYDVSGNPIECVIRTDVLVGFAWYNINEKLWQNSIYVDTIHRCKEFFSISPFDIRKTKYQTKNGFYYYVTRFGDVWSTENMTKVKGSIKRDGYRCVDLGSVHNVKVHRLVAQHFVRVPKDLSDQKLSKENLVVNHLDGNKLNNRVDNLEWVTSSGNTQHAYDTGLAKQTKLLDDCTYESLLERFLLGETMTTLASEHSAGLTRVTINMRKLAKAQGLHEQFEAQLKEQKRIRNTQANAAKQQEVAQYTLDGELVAVHTSLTSASKALGKSTTGPISNAVRGMTKTAYGFKWELVDTALNDYRKDKAEA